MCIGAGGACTNSIIKTLTSVEEITWVDLLRNMRQILGTKGFKQIPQLSSSRKMDVQSSFSFTGASGGGNKKSLFIGINYVGQQGELRGCHNDVIAMKTLVAKSGYNVEDAASCLTLMDDGQHQSPTHANIVGAFQWLVTGVQSGDSLFMHYSGHGGYVRDSSGDEDDKRDETIIPVDYGSMGQIKDDEIFAALVAPLPEGVTFTVVMDCCHSGTVFDLPYMIRADDATIQSIESGSAPEMQENPAFSFAKLMKIGKKLAAMHMAGATPAQIAQAGLQELGGVQGAMQMAQFFLQGGKGDNAGSKSAGGATASSQVEMAILNVDPSIDKNKDGKISKEEAQDKAEEVLSGVVGKDSASKIAKCCNIL